MRFYLERFLSGMSVHVTFDVEFLREELSTLWTRERTLIFLEFKRADVVIVNRGEAAGAQVAEAVSVSGFVLRDLRNERHCIHFLKGINSLLVRTLESHDNFN